MAPAREEKTSSPTPMVRDAMTAPGPKMASQRRGFRESNDGGNGARWPTGSGWGFTGLSLDAGAPGFEVDFIWLFPSASCDLFWGMAEKTLQGRSADPVTQFSVFMANRLGRLHEL